MKHDGSETDAGGIQLPQQEIQVLRFDARRKYQKSPYHLRSQPHWIGGLILNHQGRRIWQCPHQHPTEDEALDCAEQRGLALLAELEDQHGTSSPTDLSRTSDPEL